MLICPEGAVSYIANMKLAVGQFPMSNTPGGESSIDRAWFIALYEDFCYKMFSKDVVCYNSLLSQIAKVQFRGLSLGFYLLWSCEF